MLIGFEDMQSFFVILIAVFAAIATVWGGVKAIKEALAPLTDLAKRLDENDMKLDNDNKRIEKLEESNMLLLKAINTLISQELTNDQDEELKKIQKEIHGFLIGNMRRGHA